MEIFLAALSLCARACACSLDFDHFFAFALFMRSLCADMRVCVFFGF